MRKLLYILLNVILLFCGCSGAIIWKWHTCAKSSIQPEVVQNFEIAAKTVTVAEKIPLTAVISTPWSRDAASVELIPGKDSQAVSEPTIKIAKHRWGKFEWIIRAEIQAFRTGIIPAGKLTVVFEGGTDKKQSVTLDIPSFTSVSAKTENNDLILADKIVKDQHPVARYRIYFIIAAAVILLGLTLWLILRRRKKSLTRMVTIWEQALVAIADLKSSLHTGRTQPGTAVSQLNDLVRNYLEKRFSLRAEHQTTREFLDEISKGGPLDLEQTGFLRDFLNSSDLIKFAKLPADVALFDSAALRAETLVRSTAVKPENQEKSK